MKWVILVIIIVVLYVWSLRETQRDKKSSLTENERAYLKTLGLNSRPTSQHLRKTYLALCHKYHPDQWARASQLELQEAEQQMKKINEAYEALMTMYQ